MSGSLPASELDKLKAVVRDVTDRIRKLERRGSGSLSSTTLIGSADGSVSVTTGSGAFDLSVVKAPFQRWEASGTLAISAGATGTGVVPLTAAGFNDTGIATVTGGNTVSADADGWYAINLRGQNGFLTADAATSYASVTVSTPYHGSVGHFWAPEQLNGFTRGGCVVGYFFSGQTFQIAVSYKNATASSRNVNAWVDVVRLPRS